MAERLTDEAVGSGLTGLEWTREGDELVRTVTLKNFAGAMEFVNAVAGLAEAANHHPDIAISWNKVTLHLTTHDAGGLTQADLDLAARIDALFLLQKIVRRIPECFPRHRPRKAADMKRLFHAARFRPCRRSRMNRGLR